MTAGAARRSERRPTREARHQAREAALQMLYQWEVGRLAIDEVVETFWTRGPMVPESLEEPHRAFSVGLARGVAGAIAAIDPLIADAAEHWRIERMNVLDRLIMRLAVYEFQHEADTPAKVIINEALELARTFSTDDAVRFINGVLDTIRRRFDRQ